MYPIYRDSPRLPRYICYCSEHPPIGGVASLALALGYKSNVPVALERIHGFVIFPPNAAPCATKNSGVNISISLYKVYTSKYVLMRLSLLFLRPDLYLLALQFRTAMLPLSFSRYLPAGNASTIAATGTTLTLLVLPICAKNTGTIAGNQHYSTGTIEVTLLDGEARPAKKR